MLFVDDDASNVRDVTGGLPGCAALHVDPRGGGMNVAHGLAIRGWLATGVCSAPAAATATADR